MRTVICLFSLFALVFHAGLLPAQFSISASSGLNISNQVYSRIPDGADPGSSSFYQTQPALFYFFEVRPGLELAKKWKAGLGIQYSVKGYSRAFINDHTDTGGKFSFIDIMPVVEYRACKFLAVFGGLNVGLLTRERFKLSDEWIKAIISINKRTDLGGLIGLRGNYKGFTLSFHYNRSILPVLDVIFTGVNGEELGQLKSFNSNFQVGIGYMIDNVFKK